MEVLRGGGQEGEELRTFIQGFMGGSPERCRHIQEHVLSLTHHCVTCHEHCSSRVPQSTGQLRVRVCVCKKREVILINLSLIYQASETFPFIYIRIYTAHARAHTGQCTDGRCSLFMSQLSCLHLAAGTEKPPNRLVPRDS